MFLVIYLSRNDGNKQLHRANITRRLTVTITQSLLPIELC